MFTELREWFGSVCNCDGLNNLHELHLDCINSTTGNITSKVHYDGDNTAKALIDLVKVNMQSRNPPSVHLPSGWMMCLSPYCIWDCDDGSSIMSGEGSELLTFKQELVLYVKNIASCQNYINVRYYSSR